MDWVKKAAYLACLCAAASILNAQMIFAPPQE